MRMKGIRKVCSKEGKDEMSIDAIKGRMATRVIRNGPTVY